ncbi:penicillin-binding protein activator [Thermodesulfobacteriota bacterium]
MPKHKVAVKVDPAKELLQEAENLLQEKSYHQALEVYKEFLDKFPDDPLVETVLMKLGVLYATMGNFKDARKIYQRLISDYPESSLVPDARIDMLLTFYHEGKYQRLRELVPDVLKKLDSKEHFFKAYFILGNTCLASRSPLEAVHYYTMAYSTADEVQKETTLNKLEEAIQQLSIAESLSLLSRVDDDLVKSYLLFHLGLKYYEKEKYEAAESALAELVDLFPEHEHVLQAKQLIEELKKTYLFDRHTIGCLLPLTGPYQVYGQRALKGIELALDQFSAYRTTPEISVIVKDTQASPPRAAQAVNEIFQARAAAIIGPVIAAESAALEAQDMGVPIVALTQRENITDIGDFVFRNFLTPKMLVKTLVNYVIEDLGIDNFAILYPKENYGRTFMNLFWDEVIAYGGTVVGVESYDLIQTDFADPIKKLVGLYHEMPEDIKAVLETIAIEEFDVDEGELIDPVVEKELPEDEEPQDIVDFDGIFIPDSPHKAGLIIPQLAFYDVEDVYLLGTNLWHSQDLIEMAQSFVEGAIMVDGFFTESSSQHVQEFVHAFEEVYGEKPGFIEAVAYDTAMILFQIVSQPDIQSRRSIQNQLTELGNYPGVTGYISFDKNGEVRKKLYILKIKRDNFVEVERE